MWGEPKNVAGKKSATENVEFDAVSNANVPDKKVENVIAVRATSIIGPEISIDGVVSCEEDVLVLGTVKGRVEIKKNKLIVGQSGYLEADIEAMEIRVEGEVAGDIVAHYVTILKSGRVSGNIICPRVNLEDGGKFKGTVDMDEEAVKDRLGTKESAKLKASSEQSPPISVLNANSIPGVNSAKVEVQH